MAWERLRGRGAAENPPNRFERLHLEPDSEDVPEEDRTAPATQFLAVRSRSAITRNDSPDLPFSFSLNPYMGCEHGCAYCYARTYHEYWGFSAGLDFETRILVKPDIAKILAEELSRPSWHPAIINLSGITDPYQPVERRLRLTRQCLEVLVEFGNPFFVITKNHLITRDRDVLMEAARHGLCAVLLSVTTLDAELGGVLEPRASRPQARLAAIQTLADAGVPVGVNAAPLIPGLTDHELPAIIKAAVESGAQYAGYSIVRLPGAVETVFSNWLAAHTPGHREKVLNRIREIHGGRLNSTEFGGRFRGEGPHAQAIRSLFQAAVLRSGISKERPVLRTDGFRRPGPVQADMFEL
jgi:DNA repair photolyase